ncbi:MAG: molybdopterin-guanine dinucleotide biosynthesis protein B [Pseudomonadota bacterium]|nr:molybdopterin-guanine dinucleotide biosynthesis protein B [Pseudomonadota bacterium]
MNDISVPIMGFVAYSGSGKTTLLIKLIPLLKAKGLRLAVIKHTHHHFDIDKPGKDSYRLRQAGAQQTLVVSSQRWALMVETGETDEPYLKQVLPTLNAKQLDLILVEGFKHEPSVPKIEIHRPSLGRPLMFPQDNSIIAIASNEPLTLNTPLPVFDLNCPEALVEFIEAERLAHSAQREDNIIFTK